MSDNLLPADAWKPVLAAYPESLQPHQVEYLGGAGGFSGAEFWRLKMPSGVFCLRRWPLEHPTRERLTLIHDVLRHAAQRGIDFVPVPLPTRLGTSFWTMGQRFWELTPWLAGEGDFSRDPQPAKRNAALVALARFHLATGDFSALDCRVAPSPGIVARLEQLRDWTRDALTLLRTAVTWNSASDALRRSGSEIISLFEELAPRVERELTAVLSLTTRLQPAIRDVWCDHFLFVENQVTGLVDFGGLNIESPATDIARLLGSMAGDDRVAWREGLAAYETIRPLSPVERQLLPIFDHSTVALSGMNWLRWIFLQGRTFPDMQTISSRLSSIAERMRAAEQLFASTTNQPCSTSDD